MSAVKEALANVADTIRRNATMIEISSNDDDFTVAVNNLTAACVELVSLCGVKPRSEKIRERVQNMHDREYKLMSNADNSLVSYHAGATDAYQNVIRHINDISRDVID